MPKVQVSVNREMFKFGIYTLFPVLSLYVYNRPEIQDMFFGKGKMTVLEEYRRDPETLYRVPRNREEIREAALKMKEEFKQNESQ